MYFSARHHYLYLEISTGKVILLSFKTSGLTFFNKINGGLDENVPCGKVYWVAEVVRIVIGSKEYLTFTTLIVYYYRCN